MLIKSLRNAIGLYGSIREDHCSLLAFTLCLGAAILFELFLSVSAFALVQEKRLGSIIEESMTKSLDVYNQTGYKGITRGTRQKKTNADYN